MSREELIGQLRAALYQAESPAYDVVNFEVGETDFEFDFTDE